MKKLISVILVLMLAMAIPLSAFANLDYSEGPISYDPYSVEYDTDGNLVVSGYFINSGDKAVNGFETITIVVTSSDGTPVETTFDDAILKTIAVPIGSAEPFYFVMENPVQGKDFSEFKLDYEISEISVGNAVTLDPGKKIYYMGEKIAFDVPPTVINGRLLIPARLTFEKMGAVVQWNGAQQTVNVSRDGISIDLTLGSNTMMVNGTPVALEVPAQNVGGRTLVPMRAIIEYLGAGVYYNPETEMAVIYE